MEQQVRAFLENLEAQGSSSHNACLSYGSDLHCFTAHLQETLGRAPTLEDFNAGQLWNFSHLNAAGDVDKAPYTVDGPHCGVLRLSWEKMPWLRKFAMSISIAGQQILTSPQDASRSRKFSDCYGSFFHTLNNWTRLEYSCTKEDNAQ